MDSKRKAAGGVAASEDIEERTPKRRRGAEPESLSANTPETTTQHGLILLEQIRKIVDKSGRRQIASNFLTLPSKRELPDYFKFTKLPIALDTIETKLRRKEFPNLIALESMFERMVQNARDYNEEGSEIVEDAERIRKTMHTYMLKHNPAYKTSGYVPQPTAIPGQREASALSEQSEDAEGDVDMNSDAAKHVPKKRASRPPREGSQTIKLRINAQRGTSATPARSLSLSANVQAGFGGLNFQQAQEKIVSDLLKYKENEDDDFPDFEPFASLPSRSLKDYYQVIPHPVSLKGLQKLVRGIRGRTESTGVSEFKTWDAFAEEASSIWKNAYHYNEDGSEIHMLAKDLEAYFSKTLKEAKQAVPEPSLNKLKLKLSAPEPTPKISLKLNRPGSPAVASPIPTPPILNGSTVAESPRTAVPTGRNPFSAPTKASSNGPNIGALERARSSGSAASPSPSMSGIVKNEEALKPSPVMMPATTAYQPSRLGLSEGIPHANGTSMPPPVGTPTQAPFLPATPAVHQHTYQAPNPEFESKWRPAGKGVADAMFTNLTLATHPGLNIHRHFRLDLPPSATMTHQSVTINLPSSHFFLQIKPTISSALLPRQHKVFVTSGFQRLSAMPNTPGQPVDQSNPLFEARLKTGVNRIEIEIVAALPKGAPKPANGQDMEMEKITVYANLLQT